MSRGPPGLAPQVFQVQPEGDLEPESVGIEEPEPTVGAPISESVRIVTSKPPRRRVFRVAWGRDGRVCAKTPGSVTIFDLPVGAQKSAVGP